MYTLYGFEYSQHSRRVVSLLEQTGIHYHFERIDMMQGQHMSPDYLALNPNHQIPTLIDKDITLYESNAILRYLCRKHNLADWYPQEAVQLAQVECWLDWNQCILSPLVVNIVLNRVFMGDKGDLDDANKAEHNLPEALQTLEQRLSLHPYLAGEHPTIADLSVGSNLFQLTFASIAPDSKNTQAWFTKVSSLKGFVASLPKA